MSVYTQVLNNHPSHSVFDMGYSKNLTLNWSGLYPVYEQEVISGDRVKYSNAYVIKTMPLAGPCMDSINAYTHYFFVPYRLIHNKDTMLSVDTADSNTFEDYITGTDLTTIIPMMTKDNLTPNYNSPVTSWVTTGNNRYVQMPADQTDFKLGKTIIDYFGFPMHEAENGTKYDPDLRYVPQYAMRAYNKIWNDYYRDENIQDEISLKNINVLRRAAKKDYITSRLPWQEKGTPIAMPITSTFSGANVHVNGNQNLQLFSVHSATSITSGQNAQLTDIRVKNTSSSTQSMSQDPFLQASGNVSSTSFDIADFRLTYELQRWQERQARCGTRFTEWLQGHFGISPDDGTLQRPLYLGGTKTPVLVSEVRSEQFSGSGSQTTVPGSLAGTAGTGSSEFVFNRQFKENGIIIGLLSIMAEQMYNKILDRMWIKTNYYDFYSPEFANLSEQGVYRCEVKAESVNNATNNFSTQDAGYQASWNEMRARRSYNTSDFLTNMSSWSVARPMPSYALTSAEIVAPICNNIFAITTETYNNFICKFANIVKISRPLPYISEPKL